MDENLDQYTGGKRIAQSSILKTNDLTTYFIDEIEDSATARKLRRKSRVSFSSNVQIKTIDEDPHGSLVSRSNESITVSNTAINSRAFNKLTDERAFGDISNQVENQMDVTVTKNLEITYLSNKSQIPFSDCNFANQTMEVCGDNTYNCIDNESLNFEKTYNNQMLNYSCLPERTMINMTMDKFDHTINNSTVNVSQNNDQKQTSIFNVKNCTYEVMETTNQSKLEADIDLTSATLNLKSAIDKEVLVNRTMGDLTAPKIRMNETTAESNKTIENSPPPPPVLFNNSQVINSQPSTYATAVAKEVLNKSNNFCAKDTLNRSGLNNMSNVNTTIDLSAISFLEIPKSRPISMNGLNMENVQSYGESLNEYLTEEANRLKLMRDKMKEMKESMQSAYELKLENKKKSDKQVSDLVARRVQIKESYNKVMSQRTTGQQYNGFFNYKPNKLESIQADLKNIQSKNKNIDKELAMNETKINNLKEKIENNMEKIDHLREFRDEKEKFKKLWEQMFSKKNIMYNLELNNETILLHYFYDLVKLEIKAAANIFNDTSMDAQLKYLNYPIQKLFFRSMVDVPNAHDVLYSQLNNAEPSKNKVPMYLKYCVELILGDIGQGDLLTQTKKYKYVKDISMLVSHINLVCKFATNLAQDFEFILNKTRGKNIKIEFDIKNYIVSFTLPSHNDGCYYNLRLKIRPGCYYEESISFTIDQNGLNEFYEPNTESITQMIEGQYFEQGSLRNYLKRLGPYLNF